MSFKEIRPMKDTEAYLTLEQEKEFMKALEYEKPRDKLFFYFLILTGRRTSEIIAIKVGDINFKKNILYAITLKRRRKQSKDFKKKYKEIKKEFRSKLKVRELPHKLICRARWRAAQWCKVNEIPVFLEPPFRDWIPLHPLLVEMTKQYIENNKMENDNWLFPSRVHGKHVTRHHPKRLVRRIGKRAGIEFIGKRKIHCHAFRHSFVINNIQIGKIKTVAELKKIQQLLGHKSISTTDYYMEHFTSEEKMRKTAKDYGDKLFSK